jgi:hypothetical protein
MSESDAARLAGIRETERYKKAKALIAAKAGERCD